MRGNDLGRTFTLLLPFLAVAQLAAAAPGPGLVESAKSGDTAAVRQLVARGIDVNVPAADGTTALHWAAHRDDLDTAELLIRSGAHVGTPNRYGVTALSLACENGNAAMIERLLQAGADPDTPLRDNETALMMTVRAGSADAARVLVAHGANVNARESTRGQTPLMWAALENRTAAARVLINAGADITARSKGGFTPFLFAVRGGHRETVELLLAHGANVNDATLPGKASALVLAVLNDHYELASLLLKKGADPNADGEGWTALHQMVWTRRYPVSGPFNPPPVPTGSVRDLELVKDFVAHGANVNARMTKEVPGAATGSTARGGRTQLARIGATPLLLASMMADVELVRLLLELGADPLLPTAEHTTPLMAAAGVGYWGQGETPGTSDEALAVVKLLLSLGADVNAANDFGYTAMHGAAHRGAPGVVRLLAESGAQLNPQITKAGGNVKWGWLKGWTPLMIADGVYYNTGIKHNPETATALRELLAQRGLPTEYEEVPETRFAK